MALLGSLQTGASGSNSRKSDGCRWQQHRKCDARLQKK